ncbi:MAG: hypothetical protein OXT68_07030 [Chloroflexota bacterium]|nr:hypothetical protein [Chloroflexota bacterium]MDE2950504.1 hypothetical protein [Chloroflexota bacterium]
MMTGSWYSKPLMRDAKGNDALSWFKYWRPPIETLMNGSPDNYFAALHLMYPPMDRVYQLDKKKGRNEYDIKDVWKHFFPKGEDVREETYDKMMSEIGDKLRNGLAHDGHIRDGVCLISGMRLNLQSNSSVGIISAEQTNPILPLGDNEVIVDIKLIWDTIRNKIDNYYTSSGYLINHYMQDWLVAILNAHGEQERVKAVDNTLKKMVELGIIKMLTDENQTS